MAVQDSSVLSSEKTEINVYIWSGLIVIFTCLVIWWKRKKERSQKKLVYSKENVIEARVRRFEQSKNDINEKINLFKQNEREESKVEYESKLLSPPNLKNSLPKVKLRPNTNLEILPCFDKDTSLPVTRPLKTLESVLRWMPGFDEFNIASIPLKKVVAEDANKPKTLVCHDMKGGYIEDRFVQGFNSDKCYRFYHWNYIDIFVYFSHNLVTIPPPCWTNAAHLHGVKVLGTFITEWEDGTKICEEFLADRNSIERLADVLVQIADYYGFDGWLINIENEIRPVQVNNLIEFMKELTERMHEEKEESVVIWYDSVTYKGELKWQNELNGDNRSFFDACDGIFLNYTWSVHHLFRSIQASGRFRQSDVYVGVDCFGRGCFGGGGWNTYKAMQVIRDNNLSAAIFAPGWIYETRDEQHFTENQNMFWNLLHSYLYPHVSAGLPLVSSFCQGYGTRVFCNGKPVKRAEWTNLSAQQLQPTFVGDYYQLGPKEAMKIKSIIHCTDDAFNGGGCLKVEGEILPTETQTRTVFRLFRCNIAVYNTLFVSITFKLSSLDEADVGLLLVLEGEPAYILLQPSDNADLNSGSEDNDASEPRYSSEVKEKSFFNIDGLEHNYKVFKPVDVIINSGCNGADWCTRTFVIREDVIGSNLLKEVRIICGTKPPKRTTTTSSPFNLWIGELQILESGELLESGEFADLFPSFTRLRCRDTYLEKGSEATDDSSYLSTTISWDFEHHYNPVRCCDIYCDNNSKEANGSTEGSSESTSEYGAYIGRTFVDSFRIGRIKVPRVCALNGLCVTIQPFNYAYVRGSKETYAQINLVW